MDMIWRSLTIPSIKDFQVICAQTLREEQISLTPSLTDSLLVAVQPKLGSVIPESWEGYKLDPSYTIISGYSK